MLGSETTSMQLCGSGIFLAEAAARLPRPPAEGSAGSAHKLPAPTAEETRKSKAGGLLTVDAEVNFPATAVGKTEVEKVIHWLLV
jgi:hypothetical protein